MGRTACQTGSSIWGSVNCGAAVAGEGVSGVSGISSGAESEDSALSGLADRYGGGGD